MRPKLLLLDEPCEKAKEIMSEQCDFIYPGTIICSEIKDITEVYSAIYTQLTPTESSRLTVFCPCTGIDHIKAPNVIYLDDEWKQAEGRLITSTAEHTWSLILYLAKRNKIQLSGKTIGIIGFGRIGTIIREYVESFRMEYIISDKQSYYLKSEYADLVFAPKPDKRLYNDLITSNIITLHVPYNAETHHMIGKEQFEQMKDGVLLINTSRQNVVDIDALIPYLQSGKIFYADDFKNERDLSEYGALQTPHIGGNCIEAREATDIYIANKLVDMIKGGSL